MKSISITQAIDGYLLNASARHLSERTVLDYTNTFNKFLDFLENDKAIDKVTHKDIEGFLSSQTSVSKKTVLNYHTGLSALWTWACKENLVPVHVVRKIPAPEPEKRDIVPFTEDEIKAMLGSLARSRTYHRAGKRSSNHSLPDVERNRAIIMLLLDTGIRANELAELKIHQVDNRNQRIHVFGKGSKERTVPFSSRTGQALWRYLATRKDVTAGDYLFVTSSKRQVTRHHLRKLLVRLGDRAMVSNVHPHRFRHTFAIQYLRNGGDSYTLQSLLGHSTMEMVRVYLRLAQIDIDNAHRKASPVDNWHL